jgi:PilZ domain-containing protein
VQVHWKDRSGTDSSANGRTIDISEVGMRIKLPAQIDQGVYVTFIASKVPLRGTASVRTCKQQGMGYVIGLEFTGGLRWKAASAAGPQNK